MKQEPVERTASRFRPVLYALLGLVLAAVIYAVAATPTPFPLDTNVSGAG